MQKILYTFILVFIYINSYSQIPNWTWANSINGGNYYDIATDFNGDVISAGNFYKDTLEIDTEILFNQGGSDGIVVKYNSSGNVVWVNSIGATSNESCSRVKIDSDGNIYVVGYFESDSLIIGTTTLINQGGRDGFIIKYNTSGNVIWAKSIGGYATETITAIDINLNQEIYIAGSYTDSLLTIGLTTLINNSMRDVFVVKLDAYGNEIWVKSYGGIGSEGVSGIILTPQNEFYLSGGFYGSLLTLDSISLPTKGGYDCYIAKFNVLGNVLWVNIIGGIDNEYGGRMTIDNNGNTYLIGDFYSPSINLNSNTIWNTVLNKSFNDIFLIKYDSLGNIVWAKAIGGISYDYVGGVVVDGNDNIYITGYFGSPSINFDSTILNNLGGYDGYVAKYNSNGDNIWAILVGSSLSDHPIGINIDNLGNLFVIGHYRSTTLDFGAHTINHSGVFNQADGFIAKLGENILNINPNNNENSFLIYPNPFDNTFNLFYDLLNSAVQLKLFDLHGNLILNQPINQLNTTIDLSDIANGVYFIQIINGENIITQKLVKR